MRFAKQEITIQKWGNGLGLRITKPLSRLAHFEAGTIVEVEVIKEGLTIKRLNGLQKKFKNPFLESDLVNELTPYTAHLDELVTPLASEMGEEV
jgi:antitoxin component of MazEF toxin-antitoxin module